MNLKKIMFTLVIVIVILVILIIILSIYPKEETSIPNEMTNEVVNIYNNKTEEENLLVSDYSTYYTVKSCIQKFITYATIDIEEKVKVDEEGYVSSSLAEALGITTELDKKKALYQFLDSEYILINNITENNIYDFIWTSNKSTEFRLIELKYLSNGYYAAFGKLSNNTELQYYIVHLGTNLSFEIKPIEKRDYENAKLQSTSREVKSNNLNKYTKVNVNQDEMVQKYMSDFKEKLLLYVEEAYENIDEEYAKIQFKNINELKKYIEIKKDIIKNMTVSNYKIDKYIDYVQYTVLDQYNNYYIFQEVAPMKYKVLLDNYTIPLQEFKEEYYNATTENKCIMNIERIKTALNNQDYKFVYSKLADSFKSNYFNTQTSFEQYITTNIYKKIAIEYLSVETQNNNYIFKVLITNLEEPLANPIEKTIVVQLKEGTDFIFSFNV